MYTHADHSRRTPNGTPNAVPSLNPLNRCCACCFVRRAATGGAGAKQIPPVLSAAEEKQMANSARSMLNLFLQGKQCFMGGQGWWQRKYTPCAPARRNRSRPARPLWLIIDSAIPCTPLQTSFAIRNT